ncbi:hypothetical protein [Nonomuraea sp. NPDC049480]|uniref:hypothetical protein n=1 Tax=Nonomuraea sp. NPDC049480 TaxID=3364353 RepID=UPI0037982396
MTPEQVRHAHALLTQPDATVSSIDGFAKAHQSGMEVGKSPRGQISLVTAH